MRGGDGELARICGLYRRVALLVLVWVDRKGRPFGSSCQFCVQRISGRSSRSSLLLPTAKHTIEPARGTYNGLDDAQNALQPLPDIGILCLHRFLLEEHDLEVIVWLLTLQVSDALVQAIDLVLGALANGALSFAVVCALAGELLGCEIGDATRRRASLALFVGLAVR